MEGHEHYDDSRQRAEEEARAQLARAVFKGVVDEFGDGFLQRVLGDAEDVENHGGRGLSVVTEDNVLLMVVTPDGVNFTYKDWGSHHIPLDTAKAVLLETLQDQQNQDG